MYQQIVLIGRLGGDPELRYTDSGMAVCTFSMATDEVRKVKDESKKVATWWRITAWGKTGENVNQYLHKGSLALVTGRIRADETTGGPRMYQRDDGSWAASYEMTANEVKFLDSKSSEAKTTDDVPF
jgi:single-strand DNA-binding protein